MNQQKKTVKKACFGGYWAKVKVGKGTVWNWCATRKEALARWDEMKAKADAGYYGTGE